MTDASSDDFVNGLKEQYGEPGHDNSHPNAQTWGGLASSLLGATSATASGLGKGAVQSFGNAPWGSIPNADSQSPVLNWAKTEDKDYPVAEKAGRYAAEYGPLALLPEMGGVRAASKIIPEFPRAARIIGKGLEGTWKGAVGGATQGDTKTGAEVGGGTAAGTAAFMAAPSWLKFLVGMGVLDAAHEGGGVRLPWGTYHLAHPLATMAATVLGFAPGVSGALGAKAFGDDSGGNKTTRALLRPAIPSTSTRGCTVRSASCSTT